MKVGRGTFVLCQGSILNVTLGIGHLAQMMVMMKEKLNYYYITSNNPVGRSIIQHAQDMISLNNFDMSFYEPFLTKSESNMTVVLKSYESAIDNSEKMTTKFTILRLRFEDHKLKIDLVEIELVIYRYEYILLSDTCFLSASERNVLVADNIRLNTAIDNLHNSIDLIESHERMAITFVTPCPKHPISEYNFQNQLLLL